MYLNVKNISFSYNNSRKVLDNISFSVNKGETLAIVGASGSGKSTILRLIAGILPNGNHNDFKGIIEIDDKSPKDYLKKGKLSFMFQEPTLFPNLDVKENIEVPLKIKNSLDNKKVNELIETVGLNGFENYLPKDLSGGMKTRVSLARSFTTDPDLLLLDEPFSSLDIGWKQNLYNELNEIRKNNKVTVIMVTHDIQEAIYLSNSIIVLGRNGSIIDKQFIRNDLNILNSRLSDIPEMYPHELSKIQNLITIDSIRKNFDEVNLDKLIDDLRIVTGKEHIDYDSYDKLLLPLREFSNNQIVNKRLVELYQNATKKQKFSLVWDIFQRPQSFDFANKVFEDIYENLDEFNRYSNSFYGSTEDNILSVLQNRINGSNERSPSCKKWLYLCNLLYSSEIEKTESVLSDANNQSIETLEYPFAKNVANKLLTKLNEKKQFIHNS